MRSRIHAFTHSRFYAFTLLRFTPYGLLLFALCSFTVHAFAAETSTKPEPTLKKVTIRKQSGAAHNTFGKKTEETFFVEVIRDIQDLKKGLSHRKSMADSHGMLFVLDASQEHAFWMKGMSFPLDIIFIGGDMQIIEILENLQPCEECPIYFPKERPIYALEINAGLARRYGLSVGDTMVLEK